MFAPNLTPSDFAKPPPDNNPQLSLAKGVGTETMRLSAKRIL